ncbi:hypothetical protein MATL_G00057400 [Megalops atlanticus]|uniref:Outer dense fiber protein 2 n=1 Tax=Megalops atlanticus TaxID=7932 RepID=A0A9D3QBX5_MEGAT|nr:hypothetical protein MATL_G00057400 [Megalops atlanticus]
MKTPSSSPPLHVHVPETIPVHVHLKKSQKSSSAKTPQMTIKEMKMKGDVANLRASAKKKAQVPWIPPGKASIRDVLYKWEGPTHRLEVRPVPEPDLSPPALRLADLSSDEEEVLHGRINQYEKKIDSLMTEVGSLKSEVKLRKKEQQLERQSKKLSASHRVIKEQEEELEEVTKELEVTEQENTRLRQSIEKMREESDHTRLETEALLEEKGTLLRKLVEAEIDGAAAAKQVSALKETMGKIRTEKRMSGSDSALLARQKELLMQKLETFEGTNRALRHLLREHHGQETELIRLSEQREVLIKRLADAETEKTNLLVEFQDKEKEVEQLASLLETEKENARTTGELSKVLESARAHLQEQVRSKEADSSRQSVQIRSLERKVSQQQGEVEHLLEQLKALQQAYDMDKESLKRATREQKHRAERSEDTAGHLSTQLLEKETELTEARAAAESWRNRHAQEVKEKSQLEVEITVLNNQVATLTDQLHSAEDKARAEIEGLLSRLHCLTSDSATTRLENQRLKATLSTMEEKLSLSQSEVQQLKTSVKQYESLVDNYKSQLQKTRAEVDEHRLKLEAAEKEAQEVRAELEREVEAVQRQLLGRLKELEPLPEALRRTEQQLREAEEQVQAHERRSTEQSSTLADVRLKVEQQSSRMEAVREKNLLLLEENKQLKHRVESLERKLEETNASNRDLVQAIANREETIHSSQLHLEGKSRECSVLARQLEDALDDARRQADLTRDRAVSKERSAQSRVLDLETQLRLTQAELDQLRRNKEDTERRYQTRLQDVKDRLEQSDSTNRSLQNYVQFLKASYANVFSDSVLSSAPLHPSSPL